MKRTVPLLITAISGFVLIVAFFIPAYQAWGERAAVWFDILASIAFILGGGNLLKLHLKKVSDKGKGWGYSLITVAAFLITLGVGLLKVGSPPTNNVEFYGESFVSVPLDALPVFSVAGEIPNRPDGEPLPASVRKQISQENGQIQFRGWMLEDQMNDLKGYDDTLAWKCLVEQLHDKSQPGDSFAGKIHYYPDHEALAWSGYFSDENAGQLQESLSPEANVDRIVEELKQMGRKETSIELEVIPEGFEIPETYQAFVNLDNQNLTVKGPMSEGLRQQFVNSWSHFPKVPMMSPESEVTSADLAQEIRTELESLGPELNEHQAKTLDQFFAVEVTADSLIVALNAAGVPLPEQKTSCELADELANGQEFLSPTKPAGDSVELNDEQKSLINAFANGEQDPNLLVEQLKAAGTFTGAQESALRSFFGALPTLAKRNQALCFELLKAGPLNEQQREFLLEAAADEFQWKQQIGELFIASHQVKYPWSGDYSAQGTPFYWIFDFVLQPLMTTTFAMLAFYVASAAFRAFRAKNLEATLLLGTAFIILLGRTFAGYYITAWVPDSLSALKIDQMTTYIMGIFNTAGNRAIMIGIALGIVSTSLKVLLGVDRSYLGSGDD